VAHNPILLIEDDAEVRVALCEMLEAQGYVVIAVETAEAAVAQLEDGLRPSLVLVDLNLPGMSGWDVVNYLEQQPHLRAVPRIVMSGIPKDHVKLVANAVFKKPVDVATLLATIGELAKG
jgi:CheY-like chemotaxis protein